MDRTSHSRPIRRTREVVFTAACEYGGAHRTEGEALCVPVHISDALIRAGVAELRSETTGAGVDASAPSVPASTEAPVYLSRRERKRRMSNGDRF